MTDQPESTTATPEIANDSPLPDNPQDPKQCGTCTHARMDDRLPSDKRICRDGYGYKHMTDKGCGAWTASASALESEKR